MLYLLGCIFGVISYSPPFDLVQADESVRWHRLCNMANVRRTEDTLAPFVFVDTAGSNLLVSKIMCTLILFASEKNHRTNSRVLAEKHK